ncbi:trifunctional nucleotide phosphoesterase protein YfkN-like [Battus philenor]|uniref:trifunctional nucleotide phosphoesterase protein YfkN-like n=1 Tax=Battus philenor TaxID=42288 RepID=UPI0035CE908B
MNPSTHLPVFLLAVITLVSSSVVKAPDGNFELLILHNNDMHARFEQTSQLSGACTTADREAGKCYGGFPRVAYVVKEARKAAASGEGPPVLYLNAGDTYTGTAWFTIYKWKVAAEFLNALQPDAVSLGNNEFEEGTTKLSPLLNNIETPVLATNINLNNQDNKKLEKSVIFHINGIKIAIVNYLSPEKNILEDIRSLEYVDEVIAIKEQVKKLKEQDVSIVIALGNADLKKAEEIASEINDIDLVINGHKNIYFWNGTTTNNQKTELGTNIIVTQQTGKKVPIIQSYAYDLSLGKINIKFNSNGEIFDYQAEQIPLDISVPQDSEAMEILKAYRSDITLQGQEIIGSTAVVLDGDSCKLEECNFGNLITDAMMYYYAVRFEGDRWTDAPVAIIHSKAITASIAPENRPASVTTVNLMSALQSEGNLVTVKINGTVLKQFLEHSVADYRLSNPSGEFLQYSGIRVTYDLAKDPGSRLVNAVVRCQSCDIPVFNPIDDEKEYTLIMPLSLAKGGQGYSMLETLARNTLAYDETRCVTEYIAQRSPVYPEVAGRISLGNHEFDDGISGLTPFINNLTCPVLSANLKLDKEPLLQAEKNLMNSVILNINGTKIGIIGYLTPDTKVLAIRNNVDYIEEVIAIRNEIDRLKREDVQIFIALGHSGFIKDMEIAEKVEDIDLVIGGHTNTFLWNGKTPDIENPDGPYPTLVKQASGKIVPVVQAYAYTKYLGKLHMVFNSIGDLISFDGNPILLDKSIPQDRDVLEIVNSYRDDVMKISEEVIGNISVILDGHSCRLKECNMGNFIADSIVNTYASTYVGDGWTDAPVGIIQGGGIRASVAHVNLPTNITKGDLLVVMPFDGTIVKVSINGTYILKMLEHSVANYNPLRAPGKFLQVSGLKVEYDFQQQPGMRVQRVYVLCGECKVPTYLPLNKSHEYNILMPLFLAMGGDGFSSLGNHEFDNGVSGLTPFIENLTTPVLAANLVLNKVPELAEERNLRKSVVFNVSGVAVGVIGYLTPETKMLAVHNNVEYIDEIIALKEEVKNLKKEGVKIIIALGHSGYLRDMEIAKAVEGVDLVIGGHSNTFLWNGTTPDSDEIQGPYPTYVKQASGKLVPVVQAYAYTKYLGKLYMVFDPNGNIIKIDGNPILLDNKIPQDLEVLAIVEKYRKDVLNITEEVIGKTSVVLDGLSCQYKECNLGNLIADAMVYRYASEYKGKYWTDASIATIQGGGIRSSITNTKAPTNIIKGDLLGVMPFEGILVTVEMSGHVLLQMLEYGSLGNHEFDERVSGVVPFIKNLTTPVLAANLILKKVPDLQNLTNLYKSIILLRKGVKIGVIGYLTPDTKFLTPKNDVEYEDEIPAIRREVDLLRKKGVNIIIALGHSGFLKDLEIAKQVDGLDLVVGGHSNTFLWNGEHFKETPEQPQGLYPTIIKQASGRIVPVVQAYAYTKYLGKLHLIFDSAGEVIKCFGDPILLDQDIPNDEVIMGMIQKYKSDIDRINNEVVGSSLTFLDGEQCRIRECNIGNFISDVILNYTKRYNEGKYTDVNMVLIQAGRIRSSLGRKEIPFNVTRGDWITVLPFTDTLTVFQINGSILIKALEHSVAGWRTIDSPGQFLQMTGVEVVYDLAKGPGTRVKSAKAQCTECSQLEQIRDYYMYKIIIPSFLADGGDGYSVLVNLPKDILPYNELTCVLEYLHEYSPIDPKLSNRITLLNENILIDNITRIAFNSNSVEPSRSAIIEVNLLFLFTTLLASCNVLYYLY